MIVCALALLPVFMIATTAQDLDCNVQADLFFVIDGSESFLSPEQFEASKNFIVQVLKGFDVQQGAIHVGANVFALDVYDRIQLLGPSKIMYRMFETRILILQRSSSNTRLGTATFKAIADMRKEYADNVKNTGRDVTKVAIIITDGKSSDPVATAEQSSAAHEEGINIIAIGLGDIFREELENIASSPSSVYVTDDIMKLLETIKNAIKDYICIAITTTASPSTAPTTPDSSGLNDFDCPDCMIDATHGFMKHPHSCEKYIEIIADENGNKTYLYRKCRDGLFWDQYYTTCRRPEHVTCDNDPCLTNGVVSYDIEDLCSGYVICVNSRSMRACCEINNTYVAGTGCVLVDPVCIDTCNGDNNHFIHPYRCDKIPHPTDNRFYIQNEGEGHANKTLPCAPGTVFNTETCMCDLFDDRPGTGPADCKPTANFSFENAFTDSSGNRAYAGTQFVDIIDGHAQFSGNGMVNIYRFSMDDFAHKLVIRIRFRSSASESSNEALLTNCVYSKGQSSSISIRVVRSSTASVVVFSTDTTLETQQVSVPLQHPDVWNEAIYIYDGNRLYGIVDDGINPVSVESASLNGDILMRKSGIIIGAGSQLNSFTGDVNELYKCFPAFTEGYRV